MIKLKKKLKTLRVSVNSVPNEEIIAPEDLLKEKVKDYFRNHKGKDEAVDKVKLFADILEVDPFELDIYKRAYWGELLTKTIKNLRKEVFIVNQSGKWFVLQSEDEQKVYENTCLRSKRNIDDSIERSRDWVKEKKWKKF